MLKDGSKVAIACQGGGTHAAFAAGALQAILRAEETRNIDIVALSGTSGGAMCAAVVWSALVREGGDRKKAADAVEAFWKDLETSPWKPFDTMANMMGVWIARQPFSMEVSPYCVDVCETPLRDLLRKHVRLEEVPAEQRDKPKLFVGATDILKGEGVVVDGKVLTYDDLIASAAIPTLFKAVHTNGRVCWDGLFFHNPPIRAFMDVEDKAQKPDEIWVVQINPQTSRREPRRVADIVDRRNELSGNLSLNQELSFIRKINELIEKHEGMAAEYKPIEVKVVQLANEDGTPEDGIRDEDLDYASKLDRSPRLIESLMARGRRKAAEFFNGAGAQREPEKVAMAKGDAQVMVTINPPALKAAVKGKKGAKSRK